MDKSFSPPDIETRIYSQWEALGLFAPSGTGMPYCIVIPPPNVTGTLHMGHAFQDTIMDALTRFHRMRGFDTLWQPGTDHAGIATQMVVERQLAAEGRERHDMGREAFTARVWQWKAQSGGVIANQMRRLGASVDWRREKFTMDEQLSGAVIEVFVRLYREGLIYRGKRLVNWDPVLKTALSDLEVAAEAEKGHLWHIRYPFAIDAAYAGAAELAGRTIVVATTRPETLFGDTAVAVHPDDERYRALIGRKLRLPLSGRLIPIIADGQVDPAFGSGAVKITPAHDFNDYEMGLRHGLPMINIMTPDAALNDEVPPDFRGLDRLAARERVVAALTAGGFLERVEDHDLTVPRGDRSGCVLEPLLTDQWFVKIAPLAEPAIAAVKNGSIRFVPEQWSKVYFEWMSNIRDWCISRQLWWGHRIPAWYDADGNYYVGRDEADARRTNGLDDALPLRQDEDVLDTWFSSALWPFATQGWPRQSRDLDTYYPSAVLVTGFDIIFFWVARMIMMGLKFAGDVPFREVYIHGLIRDQNGQKMSKSKGNVIDPLDIVDGIELEPLLAKRTSGLMQPQMRSAIEKDTRKQFPAGIAAYGTDALRMTFASLATQSRDLRFDMARVESYRNFCNKIWNAARFVLMQTDGQALGAEVASAGLADRWIQSRLRACVARVHEAFAQYRLDLATSALYEFIWNDFCDWYLELAEAALQDESTPAGSRQATRATLVGTLESTLRALHPLAPFITEAIWQRVAPLAAVPAAASIMTTRFPDPHDFRHDAEAESQMRWVMGFILGVRQIRGEMDIAPSRKIDIILENASAADLASAQAHAVILTRLAGVTPLKVLPAGATAPISATALLGEMKILVPMAGLIDAQAERDRLSRRRVKVASDADKIAGKLGNAQFLANAPAEVVAKDTARLQELRVELEQLEAQIQRVAALSSS